MDSKQHRVFWWVAGSLLVVACVGFIWAAYRFSWPATGFVGKTLWDWLQLLIIPLVLALVAVVFNQVNARTERQLALEKQREDLLQSYLDRMSDLLLAKELRTSQPDEEVRKIARVRTISTLIQLDGTRVGYVFAFLHEAGLRDGSDPIISLDEARLIGVKWGHASLRDATLSRVCLRSALLAGAKLRGADLSGADLDQAILSHANLSDANLSHANLSRANLKGANLSRAKLKGAIIEQGKLSTEQQAQAIWT